MTQLIALEPQTPTEIRISNTPNMSEHIQNPLKAITLNFISLKTHIRTLKNESCVGANLSKMDSLCLQNHYVETRNSPLVISQHRRTANHH